MRQMRQTLASTPDPELVSSRCGPGSGAIVGCVCDTVHWFCCTFIATRNLFANILQILAHKTFSHNVIVRHAQEIEAGETG